MIISENEKGHCFCSGFFQYEKVHFHENETAKIEKRDSWKWNIYAM